MFVFYKRATEKGEDDFYFGIGWYDANDTGWHIREGTPKSFPIVIYWLPTNQVPFITKFGDDEEYRCTTNCEQEDDHERCIQELESEIAQIKKDMQENKLIAAAAFCATPNPYSFFPPFSMPPMTPLEPCNIQDTIKQYMKSNEQPKGFKELIE